MSHRRQNKSRSFAAFSCLFFFFFFFFFCCCCCFVFVFVFVFFLTSLAAYWTLDCERRFSASNTLQLMHVLQPRKLKGFRRTIVESWENLKDVNGILSIFSV